MPALFVALVDAGGRSLVLQHAGTLRLCQSVWILSCNYAGEDIWTTAAVIGRTLDYLLALCDQRVSAKKVEKNFGDVVIALLRILCTRRDAVELAKARPIASTPSAGLGIHGSSASPMAENSGGGGSTKSIGRASSMSAARGAQAARAAIAATSAKAAGARSSVTLDRTHGSQGVADPSRLSRPDKDEASRLQIWMSQKADFVARKKQVVALRDLEERASIPTATCFPTMLASTQTRAGGSKKSQRERHKKAQRQNRKATAYLRASAWEDFGDSFAVDAFEDETAMNHEMVSSTQQQQQQSQGDVQEGMESETIFGAQENLQLDGQGVFEGDAPLKNAQAAFDPFSAPSGTNRLEVEDDASEKPAAWDPFSSPSPEIASRSQEAATANPAWDPFGGSGGDGEENNGKSTVDNASDAFEASTRQGIEDDWAFTSSLSGANEAETFPEIRSLHIREQLIADGTWQPGRKFLVNKCMARGKVYASGTPGGRIVLQQVHGGAHAINCRADAAQASVVAQEGGRIEIECSFAGAIDGVEEEHNVALFWMDASWSPDSVPVYATAFWVATKGLVRISLSGSGGGGANSVSRYEDVLIKVPLGDLLLGTESDAVQVSSASAGAQRCEWSASEAVLSVALADVAQNSGESGCCADVSVSWPGSAASVMESSAAVDCEAFVADDGAGVPLSCELRCLVRTSSAALSSAVWGMAGVQDDLGSREAETQGANSNEDEEDEDEEDDMEEQSMTQKGAAAARKPPAAQRPSPVVGGARTRSAYKLTTRILRARAREVCPTPQRAAAPYARPALKPQQAGDADAAFFFYEPSEEDQNQGQGQQGRDQDQALPLKRQASLPMEHDLGPFFEFENDPAEGNDGDDVAEDGDGEQSSTGISSSSDHLEDGLEDGGSGGVSGGWVRGF
ncbi:Hypothetical Protein FCC1311_032332 [Hondaea fermentalgiana]|uniref:Uncharacterized protein n=1 Tax=Hondaea fermentalgiana TaxID=2315210 RepID=A0A2R5G7N3_9STRA|nr:Hypothetical Protein FCC1311_032332 [Hondaea fermentalgiana]|eukprot:GBG27010.1 Hypothetical Protein FCC1311_032332 [Hondaea fermentalgiana]